MIEELLDSIDPSFWECPTRRVFEPCCGKGGFVLSLFERFFEGLKEVIQEFQRKGIRTSIFVDADERMIEGAKAIGTDRIELYTESYAHEYGKGNFAAIAPFVTAAEKAAELELGLNAGHDLSLDNIKFFKDNIPNLLEVSIGHALITESLFLGLDNVVNMYLQKLK